MDLTAPRFSMISLFLLAMVFSVLAPLYWTHVEAPARDAHVGAYENQEMYGHLLPSLHYGHTRARAGDWPLWSPQIFCGVPYFSNPNHGLLQPLNAVFYFVPALPGLALHAFLGLFLMAMFFAIWLRAMGTAYIPSAIGGMVYAFCGGTAAVMSRPELLAVLAWSPLLYWMVYEYTERAGRVWLVPGGLVVALLLLTGAPVFGAVMAAGALLYGAARAVARGGKSGTVRFRPIKGLLAMAVLGLAYSAVQWVPFLAWLSDLNAPWQALWQWRGAGHLPARVDEVPRALLAARAAVVPEILYFGALSLMIIPAAFLHRQRRFEVLFFLSAALGWTGLAVWGYTGVSGNDQWMMLAYPGIAGVAALAGLGADRLLLAGRDPRSPLIWGSVVLVVAAAAVLLIAGTAAVRGPVALAILALLPFFILRVKWLGILCGLAVAFLVFVELRGSSATIYKHPYAGDRNWLQSSLPAIKEAEAQALGERVFIVPALRETVLPSNIGWLQPVENAGGAYWPLTDEQARWWSTVEPCLSSPEPPAPDGEGSNLFYPELLNYMGVRVVISERNYPWMDKAEGNVRLHLQFLRTMGRLSLWKNESAYPRVRWVPHWEPVEGVDDAMAHLLAPEFSGVSTCVVDTADDAADTLQAALPPGLPGEIAPGAAEARARLVRERPERLDIAVSAAQPGILVVADSYDTGWKAYVDGEPAPILRVNGLFRGLYLPAGEHAVVFAYRPVSVIAGLIISVAGLLLSALWVLYRTAGHARRSVRGTGIPPTPAATPPETIQPFRK